MSNWGNVLATCRLRWFNAIKVRSISVYSCAQPLVLVW